MESSNWLPVDVGLIAAPDFFGYDKDGDYDLLVGENTGFVYYFRNDGDETTPIWTHVSSNFFLEDMGSYAAPEVVENGYNHFDLVVGDSGGYLDYFPAIHYMETIVDNDTGSIGLTECDKKYSLECVK